uniref:hypothetical protein n=1 Tax=Paractinoplanes polyasparticus TaxID=2856853 RepID=UPI001C85FBC6|nr:hypothetical protein [Actinoplanes polyasparticus]
MSTTTLRVARPPRPWELSTFVLIVSIIAVGGLGIVMLATDLAGRHFLSTGGADGISPFVAFVIDYAYPISSIYSVIAIGYLAGYVVWRRQTRRELAEHGLGDRPMPWHWTIGVWQITLVAAFVGNLRLGPPEQWSSVTDALLLDALLHAVRITGVTFLLVGVIAIREAVRARFATRTAHSSDDRPTALPDRPAATVAARPQSATDDEYWQQVRRAASGVRAELALLEATPAGDRRWLLVPADGDVAAVRAAVQPGATVTVFPEPPEVIETRGFRPAPASEYHGLLEDTKTGSLVYELVTARKVGAFLSRARSARRWALYRPDDPGALTADG